MRAGIVAGAPADKAVFLLDGEELVGAKQNCSILNLTLLVPPKTTLEILKILRGAGPLEPPHAGVRTPTHLLQQGPGAQGGAGE
ncbi:MAG: hypothetical protein IPG64_22930 [Haliea sp.]|nr:hypothetical protein [Haliea sp.]